MDILKISKKNFLEALTKTMGAVDRKLINPILSHCLVQKDGDRLKLTANDLEMQISVEKNIAHDIDDDQVFTFPAKMVYDFCRALQGEIPIHFQMKNHRIRLKTATSFLDVTSCDPSQYPVFSDQSKMSAKMHFQVSQKKLKEALESIQYAIAVSDVRYYLNGVFVQMTRSELTCVATDGHRLAMSRVSVNLMQIDDDLLKGVILPRRAVLELIRLLDSSEDNIDCWFSRETAKITFDDLTFSFKLIEGKYPDYRRVIPKNLPYRLVLDRDEIKEALALVSPVLSGKDKGIVFRFVPGGIELRATNSEQQEVGVFLKVDHVAHDTKIAFNSTYVADFISHSKGKTFIFEYHDPSIGVVFSQDTHGCYVVMPLIL